MAAKEYLTRRVYSVAFKEKGRDDVVKIDAFPIDDGEYLKVIFESSSSPWRQGIWIKTDKGILVNDIQCPSARLWQDSAPSEVVCQCSTENGLLFTYNIWDDGERESSQAYSSGMLVEDLPNGRRYHCNDIGFDTSFDKLIYRIERIGAK